MKLFSTVINAASSEIINKSRFIAYIKPVESKEEADEYISFIRKKHRDATHNVPAMVIGANMSIQWASDDGEPQGTAGSPIVKMLVSEGITNIVVVVTRYFGGVKLGTGGLVRAYTKVVQNALDEAIIADVILNKTLTIKTDYTYINKIQSMEQGGQYKILDTVYTNQVELKLSYREEYHDKVIELLTNITSGNMNINNAENIFIKCPRNN